MSNTSRRGVRVLALAGAAVVLVPVLSAPAGAATASSGSGASGVTLVTVTSPLGSVRAVSAGLEAVKGSTSSAKISVVPLYSTATGAVGSVTVTPANSPKSIGAGTLALPGGLGSVNSPALSAVASVGKSGPLAKLSASALGSVSVLGQQLSLGTGSLSFASNVTPDAASAGKTLSVSSLALPTLADLLAGLGLDLSKLDVEHLLGLAGIVIDTLSEAAINAIADAEAEIIALQDQLSTTADTVAEATALVASNQTNADGASGDVSTALAPINTAITAANVTLAAAGLTSPLTAVSWDSVTDAQRTVIDTVIGAGTSAGVDAALAALDDAQAALADAEDLLAAILDLINGVVSSLDLDPLAELGGISLKTLANASKKATATGSLTVGSLEVLGEDALPAQLNALLGEVTGAVADVLNDITGVTFTPPSVAVGKVTRSTSVTKAGSAADVAVEGVKVTLAQIELPASLALDNAAALPGLDLVDQLLVSTPASVTIGQVVESARYVAASSGTTTTTTTPGTKPGLPTTGAPAALTVMALLALGGALVLRRRAMAAND